MGTRINDLSNAPRVRKRVARGGVHRHAATISRFPWTKDNSPMTAGAPSPSFTFRVLHCRLNVLVWVCRPRHSGLLRLIDNECRAVPFHAKSAPFADGRQGVALESAPNAQINGRTLADGGGP
jgi:hypothetical protein